MKHGRFAPDYERLALSYIARHGRAFSAEVGAALRVKSSTARSIMMRLQGRGKLRSSLAEPIGRTGSRRRYFEEPAP